jgi:hypothetical protein
MLAVIKINTHKIQFSTVYHILVLRTFCAIRILTVETQQIRESL